MKIFEVTNPYTGPMKPEKVEGKERDGAVEELESRLLKAKKRGTRFNYDNINDMMEKICGEYRLTGQKLHDDFVDKHNLIPDNWIKKQSV